MARHRRRGAGQVLDLGSYHAIVACVAAGAGIAFAPRSVLETIRRTEAVTIHSLQDKQPVTTSLVWRKGESSLCLKALQAELSGMNEGKRGKAKRGKAEKGQARR